MILLNSQISLYYNLRNLFLIVGVIFVLISIIYGAQVHILVIIQKYFGIEKRREIAKRRAVGYTGRNHTAKMRAMQRNTGRNSGSVAARKIDVSQVRTEKMYREEKTTLPVSDTDFGTVPLSDIENTVVLQQSEGTAVLQEYGETVVLQQSEETVVLSPVQKSVIQKQKDILVVHGEDIC